MRRDINQRIPVLTEAIAEVNIVLDDGILVVNYLNIKQLFII